MDGGNVVEIHGTGLHDTVRVLIGGVEAPFVVHNDGQLDTTVPPSSGNAKVDIQVIGADSGNTVTYPEAYTYVGERASSLGPITIPG